MTSLNRNLNISLLIFFLFIAVITGLPGCGLSNNYAPVADRTEPKKVTSGNYKVRSGDTLYSIAWKYGWDHRELARVNDIRAPYKIYPGQKLSFKSAWRSASKKPSSVSRSSRTSSNSSSSSSKPVRRGKVVWKRPAPGKVVRAFGAYKRDVKNKGIDISGYPGQAILAAAKGEVVYAGSGLLGYGQLIIIKHNSEYLSAYAHNRKILVKEGQKVKVGEKVGEMGSDGSRKAVLHFEIRRSGKPVNPLRYLPRS